MKIHIWIEVEDKKDYKITDKGIHNAIKKLAYPAIFKMRRQQEKDGAIKKTKLLIDKGHKNE